MRKARWGWGLRSEEDIVSLSRTLHPLQQRLLSQVPGWRQLKGRGVPRGGRGDGTAAASVGGQRPGEALGGHQLLLLPLLQQLLVLHLLQLLGGLHLGLLLALLTHLL